MFKNILLLACITIMGGAALLARPGLAPDTPPDFRPVADWLRLPEGFQFGPVTGVATDAADNLYIFHRGNKPLAVFDKGGKFLRSWGDDLIKTAHGVRVDPAGNVWLTDIGTHLVMKIEPLTPDPSPQKGEGRVWGKLLLTLGKKNQPGDTPDTFNKPADVAVAPGGEFYVADGYGNSRVVKFSKDGKYLKEWGVKGKGDGQFHLPHAICLDAMGRVYVGDRENNRVQVFDAEGKFLTKWTESGAPFGLFLHGEQMYVADGRAHAVHVLDRAGKRVGMWGMKGMAAGEFNLPHWICRDSQGAWYVAEVDGKRVQKFVAK